MNRKTGSLVLLFSICCVALYGVYASNRDGQDGGTYTISVPYQYPVAYDDREGLRALGSAAETIEACQVPKGIVEAITTDALIETVITYPCWHIYPSALYDTPEKAFESLVSRMMDFNGVTELLTRDNVMKAVTEKHAQIESKLVGAGTAYPDRLRMANIESLIKLLAYVGEQ